MKKIKAGAKLVELFFLSNGTFAVPTRNRFPCVPFFADGRFNRLESGGDGRVVPSPPDVTDCRVGVVVVRESESRRKTSFFFHSVLRRIVCHESFVVFFLLSRWSVHDVSTNDRSRGGLCNLLEKKWGSSE